MKTNTFFTYKENTFHGTILMPLEHYHSTVSESFNTIPTHWHEEVEITLIQEGKALYYVNLEPYQVEQGDILLISPHTLHSAHEIKENTMISDSFVFNLDILGCQTPDSCSIKYFTPILNGKSKLPIQIKPADLGYRPLLDCFIQLLSCTTDKKPGYEMMIKRDLFQLFHLLYENDLIIKSESAHFNTLAEEKLKLILSFIQTNYSEPLTVQKLAHLCHFSEVHFMNFFKKFTEMTCIEYINNYRLVVAASLLETSDKTIMDIAYDTGFHNVSYFNKLFRKKYTMTPKEYRRLSPDAPHQVLHKLF